MCFINVNKKCIYIIKNYSFFSDLKMSAAYQKPIPVKWDSIESIDSDPIIEDLGANVTDDTKSNLQNVTDEAWSKELHARFDRFSTSDNAPIAFLNVDISSQKDKDLKEVPKEAWLVQSAPLHNDPPKVRTNIEKQKLRDDVLAFRRSFGRCSENHNSNETADQKRAKYRRSVSCNGRFPKNTNNSQVDLNSGRPKSCYSKDSSKSSNTSFDFENKLLCDSFDSIPRYSGYKPKEGIYFIPFNKMFTKNTPRSTNPPSRSSSSSSLCSPLSVQNSATLLNETDKEIISKTRKSLKDRIESAHRKFNDGKSKKKKVHLNIIMKNNLDHNNGSSSSDFDGNEKPGFHTEKSKKKVKRKKKLIQRNVKSAAASQNTKKEVKKEINTDYTESLPIKVEIIQTIKSTKKKKEIPTMVSQISPVQSDVEFCSRKLIEKEWIDRSPSPTNKHDPNPLFLPAGNIGGGGLLKTVIKDLNEYKPANHPIKSAR